MKRLKLAAVELGIGLGAVFAFFSIPDIAELFKPFHLLAIRQLLAMLFSICLMINPRGLIAAGRAFAPRVIDVLTTLFGLKKKDDNR